MSKIVRRTSVRRLPEQEPLDVRVERSVDSFWKFHQGELPKSARPPFDDSNWLRVDLPHTWNAQDVLSDEPGYARCASWYQKTVRLGKESAGKRIYLVFRGANQDSVVYVNGAKVGEHLGGFTAFAFDITGRVTPGADNVLTVRVSNEHNEAVPPLGGDLMHFGGIYRSVRLVTTDAVHFDLADCASSGVYVDTPSVDSRKASVRVWGRVRNASKRRRDVLVQSCLCDPDGDAVLTIETPVTVPPESVAEFAQGPCEIARPLLWSPETPNLYHVESHLADAATGRVLDNVRNPFGFRSFSADHRKGFFLNGKRCFIKGIGRHQDYPGLGYAVPDDLHRNDVRAVREMGANFLRGHYPQTPAVYDACDELGVLCWAKIPIMDRLAYTPEFVANTKRMLREMVMQNYNHPCIVTWGYMCEPFGEMDWYWPRPVPRKTIEHNERETFRVVKAFENSLHELDPSRLTANDYHLHPNPQWYAEAGLLDVSSFVGWNVYQGWYQGSLAHAGEALDETRALAPVVPYILAEYGAEDDPRIHTYDPTIYDFSGEYQVLFHRTYLREVAKRPWIAGQFIWTLFDFQIEARADSMPHCNNKGMLRADRRPKDTYYLYRAHWSGRPMLHVATNDWTHRSEVVGADGTFRAPLSVFSNLDRVEMFHNGASLGEKAVRDKVATWKVSFVNGINEFVAIGKAGRAVLRESREIVFDAVPRDLRRGDLPGGRLCVNVGQSRTYFRDPLTGNIWLPDRPYRRGGFGHVDGEYYRVWNNNPPWNGIREGVGDNIRGSSLDPLFQTFLVGVSDYRVDVADGDYDVTLCFAEPFDEKRRRKAEEKTGADARGRRVFHVAVNGKRCIENLDLAAQVGVCRAFTETFPVAASRGSGVRIALEAVKGQPVLSGVRVARR